MMVVIAYFIMRRSENDEKILLLAAILVCVYLPAQNWTKSTNTNQIYDLSAKGNDRYLATWVSFTIEYGK